MFSDAAVLNLLTDVNTLLDSLLIGIVVQESRGDAIVELHFKARVSSKFSEVHIRFTDVLEFEFYYESDERFFDVEDLKFLELKDGTFYLSLDPDPSTLLEAGATELDASDTDHFFVHARHIEATTVAKPAP